MDLISLADYAKIHGKEISWVRRLAISGRFQTAQKIGRNWVISKSEPFPLDARFKENRRV